MMSFTTEVVLWIFALSMVLGAEPSKDGLLAWLRADSDYVDVTGTSVNSVTCGVGSTIQKFGTVTFTVDGLGGENQGYFEVGPSNDCLQMDAVNAPGAHTVFLTFMTTHTSGNMCGADPGGYGHFDTEIGFGAMNNHFIQGTAPVNGEFVMSTHYSGGVSNGVVSYGTTFNDGNWHWVEIYGGPHPTDSGNLYSLLFDTGEYFEETNVNDGWMRDGVGFYIGRGQGYFGGTAYVRDVLVYNRSVTASERSTLDSRLNIAIGGTLAPTVSPTQEPTPSPTNSPTMFPTSGPTQSPTVIPTHSPTNTPTSGPTPSPTVNPTQSPTNTPTSRPTSTPTSMPTRVPTPNPTTAQPTNSPTVSPTSSPTVSRAVLKLQDTVSSKNILIYVLASVASVFVMIICCLCWKNRKLTEQLTGNLNYSEKELPKVEIERYTERDFITWNKSQDNSPHGTTQGERGWNSHQETTQGEHGR